MAKKTKKKLSDELTYRQVMELYFKWLFEDPNPIPPEELVTSKHLTHALILSSFTMNPNLTEYLFNRITKYNVYAIPKDKLLMRIKELVQKFKVSKWDFWTLMNKKPHHDPLFKCLNEKYWIKASDIPLVKQVISKEELDQLCSNKQVQKIKDVDDIFTQIADNATKSQKAKDQTSKIEERLKAFKQYITDLLTDKDKDPKYQGCANCSLRFQPFVPPDYHIGDPSRDEVDIVFVGMNPYKDEIKLGKPFVGQSGKYLRSVLEDKCKHLNYVITNTCMCFIPNNGDPAPENIECCRPLLMQQLRMLKPKVVVPLGALAAKNFVDTNVGITKISGQVFDFEVGNGPVTR